MNDAKPFMPSEAKLQHISTHARSRSLLDYTAAVSLDYIEPLYLRTRLQRRCASNAQPTCQSAGFGF
jgi:hypothetical protein